MAIAFDSGNSGAISGSASLTISHTCNGADRVLLVFASCLNSTDFLASATVTYGGVSMGAPIVTPASSTNNSLYAWLLAAPSSGTANVVITPSSGAFVDAFTASFTGVDQATPSDSNNKDVSASAVSPKSISITTSAGGFAVDMICRRTAGSSLTPDGTQTRISTEVAGGVSTSGSSYKSAATTMVWTHAATDNIAHAVVALKASAGGGGGSTLLAKLNHFMRA